MRGEFGFGNRAPQGVPDLHERELGHGDQEGEVVSGRG